MAANITEVYESIRAKVRVAVERQTMLIEEIDRVEAENRNLHAENEELRRKNERLQTELEYMRLSSALAPTREDVEQTRAMINELVRDIDRCISDLSD